MTNIFFMESIPFSSYTPISHGLNCKLHPLEFATILWYKLHPLEFTLVTKDTLTNEIAVNKIVTMKSGCQKYYYTSS